MRSVEDALNRGFTFAFRHWTTTASLWALLTVGGAVLTPWLESLGFETMAQLLYWAYRPLCPQRPDHSFFIAGYKMAFEQRETAMFLAGAAAGPLHALLRPARLRIPGWLVPLALVPMLIDVATQSAGLREGDAFWRVVTGAMAVVPFVLWSYPHLEADFRKSFERDDAAVYSPTG